MRCLAIVGAVLLVACGSDAVVSGATEGTDGSSGGSTDAPVTTMTGVDGTDATTSAGSTTANGSSDATTSADESDEGGTFGAGVCGNGIVDPDEECDDHDTLDGDDCYADCTLPFDVVWEVRRDTGPATDFANAVEIDPEGGIVVAGSESLSLGPQRLWVQQYADDGTPGWAYTSYGPYLQGATASDVAWTPDGDLVVVGGTTSGTGSHDAMILRLDPDTVAPVWTETLDSGFGQDGAAKVALDPDGNIVVTGELASMDDYTDVWVAEYSPDGVLRWSHTWTLGLDLFEYGRALVVRDDGTVEVMTVEGVDGAHVIVFDGEGVPQPAETIDLGSNIIGAATLLPDGQALVAGSGAGSLLEVSRRDASWTPQWTASGPQGRGYGVAQDADERVYVAGASFVTSQSHAWVGAFRPNGSLAWRDEHTGPGDFYDSYADLAMDPAGDLIVVGGEGIGENDMQIYIRKLHPR